MKLTIYSFVATAAAILSIYNLGFSLLQAFLLSTAISAAIGFLDGFIGAAIADFQDREL